MNRTGLEDRHHRNQGNHREIDRRRQGGSGDLDEPRDNERCCPPEKRIRPIERQGEAGVAHVGRKRLRQESGQSSVISR